jgi:iron complex outermembrane receptor protein
MKTYLLIAGMAAYSTCAFGQPASGEKALFGELPVVEAAALHAQTLEEAPANVTIITAADIHKYGYRTLGEVLAFVRGFDITYDRIYHYAGVHGFSLPGDFNTRFLVMINGHPMTENIFGSNNFFGQDFGLDMDLIQRIEVVRGPSAALYGSNAIFATINIVTISPVSQPRLRMTAETGSFAENKGSVSGSAYLGRGANLLIEASVFHTGSQNIFIPDYNQTIANTDVERGFHTFANLVWRKWNIAAYFNSREKQPPLGFDSGAVLDQRGGRLIDKRNFITASRSDSIGPGELRLEFSYDQYRYDDRFYYPLETGIQDFRNLVRGDWLTAKAIYDLPVKKAGGLTVGLEGAFDLRNLQVIYTPSPVAAELFRTSNPDCSMALFAQQEWNISKRWTATFGARLDETTDFGHFLSPRVALVHRNSARTVYKFVYGHPFRNPTSYEQHYTDGVSLFGNEALKHETANTFEVSAEHKFTKAITAGASGYHYKLDNVIQAVYTGSASQFENVASIRTDGIEFELNGKFRPIEFDSSISFQRTRAADGRLPNSPPVLAKARAAAPLFRNRFLLSSGLQYTGARLTYSRGTVNRVLLSDVTFTWEQKRYPFQLQFGIRNLFNYAYDDPIGLAVDEMRQNGRTAFLKLSWQLGG